MPDYRISHEAKSDLASITLYGISNFGAARARTYLEKLIRQFSSISEHPAQYPRVDYIRPGYRRCVFSVHSIYFRIDGNTVEIVRILGRQDSTVLRKAN